MSSEADKNVKDEDNDPNDNLKEKLNEEINENEAQHLSEGKVKPTLGSEAEKSVEISIGVSKNDVQAESQNDVKADSQTDLIQSQIGNISENETQKKETEVPTESLTMVLNRSCSLQLQECELGQQMLNELFGNLESEQHFTNFEDREVENTQKSLQNEESTSSTEIIVDQVDLICRINEAIAEKKVLVDNNNLYQSKLVKYFKLMKAKQKGGSKPMSDKNALIDFYTQYDRYKEVLQLLVLDLEGDTNKFKDKIEKLKIASEIKTQQKEDSYKDFNKYQESIGLSALHSRTGFKLDPNVIKDFFQTEGKKESIIKVERLCNLKLEHKNLRFDKALRSKENFQGGLRLIDFEQLKIENQTVNEKVEERREAINKLNRKIANCNNLLSHIREKINFTDLDKRTLKQKLHVLNTEFKKLQKINNRNKRVRDYIKINNKNLQLSCGLLGKQDYLRKFEETVDDVNKKKNTIMKLESNVRDIAHLNSGLVNKINNKKKRMN